MKRLRTQTILGSSAFPLLAQPVTDLDAKPADHLIIDDPNRRTVVVPKHTRKRARRKR